MNNEPGQDKKPLKSTENSLEGDVTDSHDSVVASLGNAANPAELVSDKTDKLDDVQKAALSRLNDMYPGLIDQVESMRSVSDAHLLRHPEMVVSDGNVEKAKKLIVLLDHILEDEYFDESGFDNLRDRLAALADDSQVINDARRQMYDKSSLYSRAEDAKRTRGDIATTAELVGDDNLLPEGVEIADKFLHRASHLFNELGDLKESLDTEDDQAKEDHKTLLNSFEGIGLSFDETKFVTLRKKAQNLLTTLEHANTKRDRVHSAAAGLRRLCNNTLNKLGNFEK